MSSTLGASTFVPAGFTVDHVAGAMRTPSSQSVQHPIDTPSRTCAGWPTGRGFCMPVAGARQQRNYVARRSAQGQPTGGPTNHYWHR
jgi:hypothetical protein